MEHGRRLSKALSGYGYRHFSDVTSYAGCRLSSCHQQRSGTSLAAVVGRAVIPMLLLGSAMRPGRTRPGNGVASNEPDPPARDHPCPYRWAEPIYVSKGCLPSARPNPLMHGCCMRA